MKKLIATLLAVAMILSMAAVVSAAETTSLSDIDCSGWWVASTPGVEVVEGKTAVINFTNTTYASAEFNWNSAIAILYGGTEAAVNGAGYNEYWVHRSDNYGWAGGWAAWNNTGDMTTLNSYGVYMEGYYAPGCWDNYLADSQAGEAGVVTAYLDNGNVILTISYHGVTNIMTVPVSGTDEHVYVSLGGEYTVLSNISYYYCDHSSGETDVRYALAATCEVDGYTGNTCCAGCGKMVTRGTTATAIGHNYSVSYAWGENNTTCTATRVCANDATHTDSAEGTVTVSSTASCGQDGTTTWTAAFTADWAETQTTSVDVKATGEHIYGTLVSNVAATCDTDGHTEYACLCGVSETTVIPATGHTYADGVCTVCGAADPDAVVETTPVDKSYTLDDLDFTGWWTAHSQGIELDEGGVTITFKSTTYATATNNWNGPLWVLYTGDEAKVNGAGYMEYWVHRLDNYGWGNNEYYGVELAADTWLNTAFADNIAAAGIKHEASFADGFLWEDLVAALQAGVDVTVSAQLVGNNAVVTMTGAGITNTMTIPVDTSKPVYLSLTGELNTITNISVNPHTGDSTNLVALAAAMILSAAGIVVLGKKKEF